MNYPLRKTVCRTSSRGQPGLFALISVLLVGLVSGSAIAASNGIQVETADVLEQGGGAVLAVDGAKLTRSDTGLTISVRIPTPEPGTYAYPPGNPFNPPAVPGSPEAFSLWAFVFNHPDECLGVPFCDSDDFFAGRGGAGGFNVAGHLTAGPVLQMNGRVTLNSIPFGGAGSMLVEPHTAEVHVAIAPHGALQPEAMPNQLKTPIGNSNFWWPAFFLP